jgi:SAM-dependent methyltransferase
MLKTMMDDPQGRASLDVGSDNGVISLLLRELGGRWDSADLIPDTVAAIKALVGEHVSLVGEDLFPYQNEIFDQVLIVDFLEHITQDKACVRELSRILKPGGVLVVNVPNPKEGLLRRIRFALGQTDEAHGHVRPGYTLRQLEELLAPAFTIERSQSYARIFSELIDTAIVGGLDLLKGGKRGKKGKVVTASDLSKMQKSFRLYRAISPILRLFMFLDQLVPFLHGNMLIVRARKRAS